MTSELEGVIPITATPFDAAGQVDEASIATLVEFEARCGVHGLNVRASGSGLDFHTVASWPRARALVGREGLTPGTDCLEVKA